MKGALDAYDKIPYKLIIRKNKFIIQNPLSIILLNIYYCLHIYSK